MSGLVIRTKIFEFISTESFSLAVIADEQRANLSHGALRLKADSSSRYPIVRVVSRKGEDHVLLTILVSPTKGPVLVHCEEKFKPPAKPGKA